MTDSPTPIPSDDHGQPLWRKILSGCGYPTSCVVLDFETYFDSEYSLKKMSTAEYIMDGRFEDLGVASAERLTAMGDDAEYIFPNDVEAEWHSDSETYLRDLQRRFGERLSEITVIMQNARFDASILAWRYGVYPEYIIDTKGLASAYNARRKANLATLAEMFGLPAKGDTAEFKGCSRRGRLHKTRSRKKNAPPQYVPPMDRQKEYALGEYAKHDAWLEWQVFVRLLPYLSRPDIELRLMQHTLELYTKPVLHVDFERAERIKADLQKTMDDACDAAGTTPKEIASEKGFLRAMEAAMPPGERVPMKASKKGMIPAIAKEDPERKELEHHKSESVRQVMAARSAVQAMRLHVRRVDNIVAQARATDGKMAAPLKYHGAATGRWSGEEKINLQNLPSRNKYDAVNQIREVLTAPPEHRLVIADASAVEARGTAWAAGQDDMIELFNRGEDLYCVYASEMAKKKIRKPKDDDPEPIQKYMTRMRNMGKVQVLGCGYGMGWEACKDFARDTYDILLTDKEALDLVQTYRKSVPKITEYWRSIEHAFRCVAKYGRTIEHNRGVRIEQRDHVTVIVLPSGRELRYEYVKVGPIQDGEPISMNDPMTGFRTHIWGGHLTENIVQAVCRDLLAEAIMSMESRGWPVVLHCHDEIVAVAHEEKAGDALKDAIEVLSHPPGWAAGFPLAAEGKISERYEK